MSSYRATGGVLAIEGVSLLVGNLLQIVDEWRKRETVDVNVPEVVPLGGDKESRFIAEWTE